MKIVKMHVFNSICLKSVGDPHQVLFLNQLFVIDKYLWVNK